jgi:hypothetical protein
MLDERFEGRLPPFFELRRVRLDIHAIRQCGGACGHQSGGSLDTHEAQAADARGGYPLIVAKRWEGHLGSPHGIQHRSMWKLIASAVDKDAQRGHAVGTQRQLCKMIATRSPISRRFWPEVPRSFAAACEKSRK